MTLKTNIYKAFKSVTLPLYGSGIGSRWPLKQLYRIISISFTPNFEEVVKINECKMIVRTQRGKEAAGSGKLLLGKKYDALQTELFKQTLKPGMNVIDVGANIGYYTLLAAKLVGIGRVWSIEPEPQNFNDLTRNVALNGFLNVTALNVAVGDRKGYTPLYVSAISAGTHSTVCTSNSSKTTISVEIRPLDDIIPRGTGIDLVKTDTEGGDFAVLRGAKRLISDNPKIVWVLEVWPEGLKQVNESIYSLLHLAKSHGFCSATMLNEWNGMSVSIDLESPIALEKYLHKYSSCNVVLRR